VRMRVGPGPGRGLGRRSRSLARCGVRGGRATTMKLNRESIAAGIVLFALAGATGCKHKNDDSGGTGGPDTAATATATAAVTAAARAAAPADTAAAAPAGSGSAVAAADAPEPPAEQKEEQGKPPSADHTWVAGHWHWNGYKYEWIQGYWVGAATQAPPTEVR